MIDRLPDPRFPVPDRNIKPGKAGAESKFFHEIDIGFGHCVMTDGRPAMFENWFDCDTQTFCRTVYYSAMKAEEWNDKQHFNFVKESGLIEDKTYPRDSVGLTRIEDETGRSWWSVTVGIQEDDD